jgi:hypothetical protein
MAKRIAFILSAGALAFALSLSPISFDQHSLQIKSNGAFARQGSGGGSGGYGGGYGGGGGTGYSDNGGGGGGSGCGHNGC